MERLQMALRAALEMELPAGCSRIVHLVDPARYGPDLLSTVKQCLPWNRDLVCIIRDASKEALVASLEQDVRYTAATVIPTQLCKGLERAQALNRVLGSTYPKDAAISSSDYIMVLDDDQVKIHRT